MRQDSNIFNTSATFNLMRFSYIALIISFLIFQFSLAQAKCTIPIPDMWTNVSNRNAAGYYIAKHDGKLILYSVDEGKNISIDIKGIKVAYSAAGGDENISNLKSGIQMRIWYVGCRLPKTGLPKAAYIEFYSNNPLDNLPDEQYLKISGR